MSYLWSRHIGGNGSPQGDRPRRLRPWRQDRKFEEQVEGIYQATSVDERVGKQTREGVMLG